MPISNSQFSGKNSMLARLKMMFIVHTILTITNDYFRRKESMPSSKVIRQWASANRRRETAECPSALHFSPPAGINFPIAVNNQ